MLQQEAHNLVRRWIEKGQRCNPKKLDGAFDKFFSYFVAYNALYSIASLELRAAGRGGNNNSGDRTAATEAVIHYIGAERLWRHLTEYSKIDIEAIRKGLMNERYGVSIDKATGEVNRAKDKELVHFLQAGDDEVKCRALLMILYLARCNMFHGNKLPTHIQIEPLGHLSKVLFVVTELLCSSLHVNDRLSR